jgi:uncharacterized membrane protein YgdD (TMEM256/DUF423 family)
MNDDLTTKVLATLGSVALGFCAMINAVIAAVALFTGNLFGAVGDAKLDAALTESANHTAASAKALAIAFGVLAALEFGAGEFLRRRVRNVVVAIACAVTIVGEVAFSTWVGHFTALDVDRLRLVRRMDVVAAAPPRTVGGWHPGRAQRVIRSATHPAASRSIPDPRRRVS